MCSCTWMYGELTEKEAVERVDRALDHHLADQFEILLYKKNRTCPPHRHCEHAPALTRRTLLSQMGLLSYFLYTVYSVTHTLYLNRALSLNCSLVI